MKTTLQGFAFLVTGIVDRNSLAMAIAKELVREGGTVVCTGLGRTQQHAT